MTRILILLGGLAVILGSCASVAHQETDTVPPATGSAAPAPRAREAIAGGLARLQPDAPAESTRQSGGLPAPSPPPGARPVEADRAGTDTVGEPPAVSLPGAGSARRGAAASAGRGGVPERPLPAPTLETEDAAEPGGARLSEGAPEAAPAVSDTLSGLVPGAGVSSRPGAPSPPTRASTSPPPAGSTDAGAEEREGSVSGTSRGAPEAGSPETPPPDRRLPGPDPATPPVLSLPSESSAAVVAPAVRDPVSARVHGRTQVTLPGLGWTYLGNSSAVEYLGRSVQGDTTVFTFRPLEEGSHDLAFQRQDLSTGSAEESSVTLATGGRVRSDGEQAVADAASDGAAGRETTGEPSYQDRAGSGEYGEARDLLEAGRDDQALAAYLRAYDGNADVAAEIARLSERVGRLEAALFFWEEAVAAGGPVELEARERLFEHYVDRLRDNRGDAGSEGSPAPATAASVEGGVTDPVLQAALGHAEALLREDVSLEPERSMHLAERLLSEGRPAEAERLLASVTEGRADASAHALYLLGRAYEARRRPSRAIAVYRRIMDNHLLSSYYEGARERYEYLRRHFLHVR